MTRALATCAVLFAVAAQGEEAKVEVMAEVVVASNTGSALEPPKLAKMKEEFAKSGIHFSSFRRLSERKVALSKGGAPVQVELDEGRAASLRLEELKEGKATLKVSVPKLVDTTYTLGRSGSLFIKAGKHRQGQLILVVSPVEEAR
jgi:hypothetical protein